MVSVQESHLNFTGEDEKHQQQQNLVAFIQNQMGHVPYPYISSSSDQGRELQVCLIMTP